MIDDEALNAFGEIESAKDRSDREIIETVFPEKKKVKRPRKPWVYKSEYDRLKQMDARIIGMLVVLSVLGWALFLISLITK